MASKNQNNSGAQKNDTDGSTANYSIGGHDLKAYADKQETDKPGQGQQMDKTRVLGDSR